MGTPIYYDPNTPSRKLSFADWQVQFIQNFTQLGEAFSKNHVPLDDPNVSNRGNHTVVELTEQLTDGQTNSNEFSIFVKDVESQTDQIFFTYPGNSPVVQFTNYQIYSVTPTPQQVTNFTFLPGGILIYFGTFGPYSSPLTDTILTLNPPIAKNLISLQFSLSGSTPDYSPSFTVLPYYFDSPFEDTGIIKSINIVPNSTSNSALKVPQAIFYMAITNI